MKSLRSGNLLLINLIIQNKKIGSQEPIHLPLIDYFKRFFIKISVLSNAFSKIFIGGKITALK